MKIEQIPIVVGKKKIYHNYYFRFGSENCCLYCRQKFYDVGMAPTAQTKGHLRPNRMDLSARDYKRTFEFDPYLPHHEVRFWVRQCRRCNVSQGNLNVRQWALWYDLPFKHNVVEAIELFRKHGLLANDF